MSKFTRATIVAATDLLGKYSQAEFHRFALGVGMERIAESGSVRTKCNSVAQYLLENPDAQNEYGENHAYAIVRQLVEGAAKGAKPFHKFYPELHRALLRDGFTLEGEALRRSLPDELDLPQADSEVHQLMREFGFTTALGHLDQGIRNHTSGDFAAANSMFRSCLESVLDESATKLAQGCALPAAHSDRRQWLANHNPPFFDVGLNEWDPANRSKGFVEALYRRLCPEGPHPGLSDVDDSTFRLHLVLLNVRVFLRRLKRML